MMLMFRFPIVINEAEPSVHLAVKAHAPNLVQFEGWVHRCCSSLTMMLLMMITRRRRTTKVHTPSVRDRCMGRHDDDENSKLRVAGSKTWTGTCVKKATECTQSDTSR